MSLADFLLARIAEDEVVANDFIAEGPWQEWARADTSGIRRDDEYAQLTIGAARVLSDCEARRYIIAHYQFTTEPQSLFDRLAFPSARAAIEIALRALASVYADHRDYRREWKP